MTDPAMFAAVASNDKAREEVRLKALRMHDLCLLAVAVVHTDLGKHVSDQEVARQARLLWDALNKVCP